MKQDNKKVWYNNADILTNIILVMAVVIIVISQAIAVNSNLSAEAMIRNLFNHNFTYIAGLIYFLLLKTSVGRKNFSLLNVIYMSLYNDSSSKCIYYISVFWFICYYWFSS